MSNLPSPVQKHGNLAKAMFTFEVPGETIVALFNALSFVVEHQEDYEQKIQPCSECIAALKTFRVYLSEIMKKAPMLAQTQPKSN